MTFLPIVARELRVTARKRSTYWIRFAAAAIALAIGAWSFFFLARLGAGAMAGKILFGGLFGLAWLHAVLGGVLKTADTLSEEKREGTLGLLFLTDLKGYDIVLGKIVAASVNWFFGLIALFPIMALALLMGGVAPGEFWRKILGLTNLLFYSLALGMFVSSLLRNERHAAGLTIALLLLLLWAPGEMAEAYKKASGAPEFSPWLVLPDVMRPFHYADDFLYNRNPANYWKCLVTSHGVAWLFLIFASAVVPRTWQQSAGKISHWQERIGQLAFGRSAQRRQRFRRHALALNPFYWIAARARGQSLMLFLVLLAVGCFFLSYVFTPNEWLNRSTYILPAFVLQGIVKIWLALAAGRRFVEDRRSGALELILATPLTEREIIRGQWSALIDQFRWPFIFVLLVDAGLLFIGRELIQKDPNEHFFFESMFIAGMIVFVADVIALAWLSMWRGLKARHSYTAWLWSLVQVLALPWVVFYIGLTVGFMVFILPQFISGNNATATIQRWSQWFPTILIGLWTVVSVTIAILSAWWSRRCLRKYFRYQATLSFGQIGLRRASAPAAPSPIVTISPAI